MSALQKWRNIAENKCSLETPGLCPGILVAAKLLRSQVSSEEEALAMIMSSECKAAKKLLEKPWDYALGVAAGVAVRNEMRGKGCGETGEPEIPKDIPGETRRHVKEAISAIKKAGLRVLKTVPDGEIVHIVLSAGCGNATISCGPLGCSVTDAEGVEARIENGRIVARCGRSPPYLGKSYVDYLA